MDVCKILLVFCLPIIIIILLGFTFLQSFYAKESFCPIIGCRFFVHFTNIYQETMRNSEFKF